MEDFNSYAKSANGGGTPPPKGTGGLFETVSRLAKQFDGKGQNELLRAIYREAEKGKKNGTLTNAEIDNFVALLSPVIDGKKRGYLNKIAEELKKI